MKNTMRGINCRVIMKDNQFGFTLLELLITMVIVSVISLGLFQSLSSMLQVTERAVKSGERVFDSALLKKQRVELLASLVPSWPDKKDPFVGGAESFSGVSASLLSLSEDRFGGFEMYLTKRGGDISVNYRADGLEYVMQNNLPAGAKFIYLGQDSHWYDEWPNKKILSQVSDDNNLIFNPPDLPSAIGLDSGSDEGLLWVVAISRHKSLPPLLELGR